MPSAVLTTCPRSCSVIYAADIFLLHVSPRGGASRLGWPCVLDDSWDVLLTAQLGCVIAETSGTLRAVTTSARVEPPTVFAST